MKLGAGDGPSSSMALPVGVWQATVGLKTKSNLVACFRLPSSCCEKSLLSKFFSRVFFLCQSFPSSSPSFGFGFQALASLKPKMAAQELMKCTCLEEFTVAADNLATEIEASEETLEFGKECLQAVVENLGKVGVIYVYSGIT
eukprot:GHVU01069482.1.p4 GENE.GHVU01069482.1~~GHVU01069482.1.p4  ORF type:complete len:143 (+),score=15.61 GHVU01069482.1:1696-2124(+)